MNEYSPDFVRRVRAVQGIELERGRLSWDEDKVMLYAVGVGAGLDDNQRDLPFTTENTPGCPLQVLPTFIAQMNVGKGSRWCELLGWGDDPWTIHAVHGEQSVSLARQLPARATVDVTSTLDGVYDKGSGALVVTTQRLFLAGTGEYLGSSTISVFVKGKGGFGGPRQVPGADPGGVPERVPDLVVSLPTGRNQSLIFRLLGDHNAHGTHFERARGDGFERPILYGLSTFGFAGRALLRGLCDNDPARFGHMQGRFSNPAYPGEQLDVRIWQEVGGGRFQVIADGKRIALDRGVFRYAGA
jgi:acyl dehydratase